MRGSEIVLEIQVRHEQKFADSRNFCMSLVLSGIGSSATILTLAGSMIILHTYMT